MAWSEISNNSTSLDVGSSVRVTVTFFYVPFAAPSRADIISQLSQSGDWGVSGAEESFPFPNDEWKITGVMLHSITIAELTAMVVNKLNTWGTWSVQVQKVEVDVGFRPNDLLPSTSTTMALVAIALIVLIGYIALRKAL